MLIKLNKKLGSMKMSSKMKSENDSKKNSKPDVLMREYAEAAFKASVSVSVTQSGRWTNINLALFGGRAFMIKEKKCMSVQLTRQGVFDLISHLQKAREIQYKEFERLQQEEESKDIPDEWTD